MSSSGWWGAAEVQFLCYQDSGTGGKQIKGAQLSSTQWGPELAAVPLLVFLTQLFPF